MPAKKRSSQSNGRVTPKGTQPNGADRRTPKAVPAHDDRHAGFGRAAPRGGQLSAGRSAVQRSSHHRGQR